MLLVLQSFIVGDLIKTLFFVAISPAFRRALRATFDDPSRFLKPHETPTKVQAATLLRHGGRWGRLSHAFSRSHRSQRLVSRGSPSKASDEDTSPPLSLKSYMSRRTSAQSHAGLASPDVRVSTLSLSALLSPWRGKGAAQAPGEPAASAALTCSDRPRFLSKHV